MSTESQTALTLAPNSIEAHRARGYVLEVTGNPQQAIESYQNALKINPNIAEIHASIARVYYSLEVYDKAFDEFSRAYALNPTDTTPNAYIARIYAKQGVYAKAAQYAEQAVNDDPTNARWRGLLGTMYYRAEDYAKAAEQLALVVYGGKTEDGRDILPLDLKQNDYRISEYYYIFGLTLVNQSRCSEAIPVFNQVLNDVPDDEYATYNATEGLRICTENIGVTPTPDLTTVPEGDATPEVILTP
jgi:tetratricopeptide (TPR) repeat protein